MFNFHQPGPRDTSHQSQSPRLLPIIPYYPSPHYIHPPSSCTNGFAISSLPSVGEINTSSVPRATTNPSDLDDVFPSSSNPPPHTQVSVPPHSKSTATKTKQSLGSKPTSQNLLHLIQHQIHQLIIPLQRPNNYHPPSRTSAQSSIPPVPAVVTTHAA